MINLWLKIKKNKGKLLLLGLFATFFAAVAVHIYSSPKKLEVIFLDVGQGDSTLIKTPAGQVILIDGGPDNQVVRHLGDNLPFYRRQIDVIILSHYHDDHIIGLVEVLKRYQVKQIIYGSGNEPTGILNTLFATAKVMNMPVQSITKEAQLSFGPGCSLAILNPVSLKIKADPNNSLVTKLSCAGVKFLLSGDNSVAVEKLLIKSGWDLRAAVFKASHHGSNSANSEVFLRAVKPQLMVISVGAANKFGHPSPKILNRAKLLNIPYKRTDIEGEIVISSP